MEHGVVVLYRENLFGGIASDAGIKPGTQPVLDTVQSDRVARPVVSAPVVMAIIKHSATGCGELLSFFACSR